MLRYVIIYFVSGFGGNLFSSLTQPSSIGVGASGTFSETCIQKKMTINPIYNLLCKGAILGLIGAFLAEIIFTWYDTDPRVR